jgi:hypothetical protein
MSQKKTIKESFWDAITSENQLLDEIINHMKVSSPSKIVDLVCGVGDRVDYLVSKGLEAMGLDKNSEKIKEGLNIHPHIDLFEHDFANIFYSQYFTTAIGLDGQSLLNRVSWENEFVLHNIVSCLSGGGSIFLGFAYDPLNPSTFNPENLPMILSSHEQGKMEKITLRNSLPSLPSQIWVFKKQEVDE